MKTATGSAVKQAVTTFKIRPRKKDRERESWKFLQIRLPVIRNFSNKYKQ